MPTLTPSRPIIHTPPAPPAMEAATPAPSPSKPKGEFYIPSLDGLRALAFAMVFLAHAGLGEKLPGGFGVTVFFFLSGYLITTLLRMEFEKTQGVSFRAFYLRRVLRILPPFYIVLALAVGLTLAGVLRGTILPGAVIAQVLHFGNYYAISHAFNGFAPGSGVYWSLAVEEHFYLVFPLVYLLLRRYVPSARRQMQVLLGICAAVLAWRCFLVLGLHSPTDRTYLATDTRVDSILFGCILAVFGNPMLDREPVSERRTKWFWLPVGILALLASFAVRGPVFRETFRYTLQGLALFPVFIAAIRYPDWGVFRALNLRWVRFAGLLSYSLYLTHHAVIYGVHRLTGLSTLVQGVLALAISVTLATLMYFCVEKPCARLRRRLSRVLHDGPGAGR